jgi:GAF domain-containing protein
MTIGPIQAFVIGFPDSDLLEGRIAEELARLSEVGQIRIIDAVFVFRDGDDVTTVSVSDLDDDQRAVLRTAVGALIGLGVAGAEGAEAGAALGAAVDADAPTTAERVADALLEDLPDGSSALVLAIEHLWAVPLRDAVRDAGGLVLAHRSLTLEDLVALGMALGDAAQRESP